MRLPIVQSLKDQDPIPTAGHWFQLTTQLLDQFEYPMLPPTAAGSAVGYRVKVSIEDTEDQGAVLWGTTSNTTGVTR